MLDFEKRVQPDDTSISSSASHGTARLACKPGRRDFLLAASGLSLTAGFGQISGCANADEPAVRISTNPWIGYELLYLSRELNHAAGQSDDRRERVRLVELLSNTDSLQALAAGTVDGAGLTLDEAISARASGLDLKIVLVFDFSAGADVLIARPEIAQLAALKGQRIGVERTGVGALMLDAVLQQASLTANDVQVIDLTVDQHLAAFTSRQVDALVTFEPIASQVAAAGGRRLFDSQAIPGSIVDVLAVSASALEASPHTVRELVAGYFQALAYLRDHAADAHRRMAPRLNLSPAALQAGYRGLVLPDLAENKRLLGGSPSPLVSSSAKLAALMLRQKLLARPIALANFCVDHFLPDAQS